MNETTVKKAWKSGETRFVVDAEHNRGIMVGNQYLCWSPGRNTVALFGKFNLPLGTEAIGRYDVNGTVTRAEGDTPNLAYVLSGAVADAVPVELQTVKGGRLVAETGEKDCYIFSDGLEGRWYCSREYVQVIEEETGPDRWTGKGDGLGPVVAYRNGKVVGIVMPIRIA